MATDSIAVLHRRPRNARADELPVARTPSIALTALVRALAVQAARELYARGCNAAYASGPLVEEQSDVA